MNSQSEYFVTGSAILTDAIFAQYGGETGTTTADRRGFAYQIAEQQAVEYLGTPLQETTLTGTFAWPENNMTRFMLPFVRLHSIGSVVAIYDSSLCCDETEITACARIINPDHGIIDLKECATSACNGCAQSSSHFGLELIKFRITFTAGLPDALSDSPYLRMGLVAAAKIALEQIIDPTGAEGGEGDPSLKNFSNTGYSETRQFLQDTSFGGSPLGNYAARMLKPLKLNRALRL